MKPLLFEQEALAEYREAASRYAAENATVALRFIEQVEEVVESIRAAPHAWPMDKSLPGIPAVRRHRVEGFSHAVVYLETPTAIHVLAVAHGKRRPGCWLKRLP